jgi:hypothetical protein
MKIHLAVELFVTAKEKATFRWLFVAFELLSSRMHQRMGLRHATEF